jgi:hypothetical protein
VVRAIARRRKALVAELLGHFGNAASVRATPREPRSQLQTGPSSNDASGESDSSLAESRRARTRGHGGMLSQEEIRDIRLDPSEHDQVEVHTPEEWANHMNPDRFPRLRVTALARRTGRSQLPAGAPS